MGVHTMVANHSPSIHQAFRSCPGKVTPPLCGPWVPLLHGSPSGCVAAWNVTRSYSVQPCTADGRMKDPQKMGWSMWFGNFGILMIFGNEFPEFGWLLIWFWYGLDQVDLPRPPKRCWNSCFGKDLQSSALRPPRLDANLGAWKTDSRFFSDSFADWGGLAKMKIGCYFRQFWRWYQWYQPFLAILFPEISWFPRGMEDDRQSMGDLSTQLIEADLWLWRFGRPAIAIGKPSGNLLIFIVDWRKSPFFSW